MQAMNNCRQRDAKDRYHAGKKGYFSYYWRKERIYLIYKITTMLQFGENHERKNGDVNFFSKTFFQVLSFNRPVT